MFWKCKTEKSPSDLTLDAALKAVARYGDVMEGQGSATLDTSLLPLPKAHMKQTLMMAWKSIEDERLKTMIGVGYVNLANFQEGVGNEPVDCKKLTDDPSMAITMIEPWLKWSKITNAESDTLLEEWRKFTGDPNEE